MAAPLRGGDERNPIRHASVTAPTCVGPTIYISTDFYSLFPILTRLIGFYPIFPPLLFFTSGSCWAPPSCCEPCGTATASTYYFLLFFLPKNWCNPLPLPLPLSDLHHSFSIFFPSPLRTLLLVHSAKESSPTTRWTTLSSFSFIIQYKKFI